MQIAGGPDQNFQDQNSRDSNYVMWHIIADNHNLVVPIALYNYWSWVVFDPALAWSPYPII